MADIDLKTETPDTTLPTTGFLFGADSQAASAPSVYSTQTVATTLLGSTSLTGATITADAPVLNMSQTWNNGAVTFTGLKFNATDTASAAASLLMDLQLEGTSKAKIDKAGTLTLARNLSAGGDSFAVTASTGVSSLYNAGQLGWTNAGAASTLIDTILTRRAAANLRFGAADAAAPVAQTLSVQSVVAGTTNTAGANLTITGSQGTGTGAGGSIIFQVAPAGSSGTAQNALATALTIGGDRRLSFPDGTFIINDAPTGASNQIGIWAGGVFGLNRGGGNASQIVLYANGVSGLVLNGGTSGGAAPYLSFASPTAGTHDIFITRDAANTLALRNGANAQAFRVYNTTDGTNSEFASLYWAGNTSYFLTAGAGTGTSRNMAIGTAANSATLTFWTSGVERWRVDGSGHFIAVTDNTYDIGASGANRPRNVYFAGTISAQNFSTNSAGTVTAGAYNGNSDLRAGQSSYIWWNNRSQMSSPADGNILLFNFAATDFGRLQFGGTTSSFPALKRSSTTLQARLADDSAFASVQGKITTDTAYTAGDPATTGYLVVYDSTGTAYKIPALAV